MSMNEQNLQDLAELLKILRAARRLLEATAAREDSRLCSDLVGIDPRLRESIDQIEGARRDVRVRQADGLREAECARQAGEFAAQNPGLFTEGES